MDVELEFREPHVRLTMLDEGHSSVAQSGIDAAIAAAAATVERAGGSVTVIRASILRTKVEITLPLIETAAVKAVAASESAIVRHGLQEVLRTAGGIELVAIADGPNRLVETCRALSPDVAILALGSVSADSVAQMSWIRDASPGTELLVLAPRVETWDVEACLNAGARGCMPDDLEPGELAAAVRGVADGDYQVPRPVSDTMLSRYAHLMADRGGHEALSQREIEVLALMVRGCKNREIADQLFISQHTVKSHVARVFQKLGVPDRASAVRVALLRRLVVDAPD
jgi:DNA-binding NarL/FixJ family response regulator